MKLCSSALLILFVSTAPAFAVVNISSPSNADHVSSPFTLSASASNCSSQSVQTLGYSLDNSSDTTLVHNSSMDTKVSASAGTHTLHVKAWGDKGSVCVSDVAFTVSNVTDDVTADTSLVPSSAKSISSLQTLTWRAQHDSGTNGSSKGSTSLVGSPSHSGTARRFVSVFKDSSGERYSTSFGDDRTSTNFLWDAWVYFTSSSTHVANLEMDLNQTMSNGDTVIFGVQCSAYSGTWEYTENLGSAKNPKGHWASSGKACNPRSWSIDKWHHVQISYSRTSTGHVTYKSVYLDGHESVLNHTVFAARALGWGPSLSTNFQLDSRGAGTVTAYVDDLIVKRW